MYTISSQGLRLINALLQRPVKVKALLFSCLACLQDLQDSSWRRVKFCNAVLELKQLNGGTSECCTKVYMELITMGRNFKRRHEALKRF